MPPLDLELTHESLPAAGPVEQLVILLHGWASDPQAMLPLAEALRGRFPQAALLAPAGPHAADGGRRGRQWYSIEGLREDGGSLWAERVEGMAAQLEPWVRAQQRRLGVGAPATALAGFSQGGIVSLALALAHDGIAGRVLCFGGCLVREPAAAPRRTTLHLFHGSEDRIFAADEQRRTLHQLDALGGDATLDIAEGIGHELHPALIDCALHRLTSHIPQRTWRAALGAVDPADPQETSPAPQPPARPW